MEYILLIIIAVLVFWILASSFKETEKHEQEASSKEIEKKKMREAVSKEINERAKRILEAKSHQEVFDLASMPWENEEAMDMFMEEQGKIEAEKRARAPFGTHWPEREQLFDFETEVIIDLAELNAFVEWYNRDENRLRLRADVRPLGDGVDFKEYGFNMEWNEVDRYSLVPYYQSFKEEMGRK